MALERLPEVAPLHMTDIALPKTHPRFGEACPVLAFLILHPDGPILIDTGVGRDHEGIDRLYAPTHHSLEDALEAQRVAPSDILTVINTHLHFDHCGQNGLFPDTVIYVQRAEYDAAHEEALYTIVEWVDFEGADYRLLDGETEIAEGVVVLPTPGHTPGHQSVLVSADDGRALIAGHATYSAAEFAGVAPASVGEWDDGQYAASRATIRNLQPDRAYFSHHPDIWKREEAK